MKVILALALCLAVASAGKVDHTPCAATGTTHEIRVANNEGPVATLQPGTPYACEGDVTPSSAHAQLRLKVTATYLGFPITILDVALEGSSVQPGVRFTVRFTITPNDILSGNTLPIKMEVSSEASGLVEACATISVRIL